MPAQILWPIASSPPPLNDNEAHVWAAALDLASSEVNRRAEFLSEEERERAAKFRFEKHRNRFIAARAFMREILGSYLGTAPAKLEFTYGSRGKPSLPTRFGNRRHFNLAHSEDLALLAVTRAGEIGVDVEFIRPMKDMDALVARFFSSRENALFQKLPGEQKPQAFFNLWTRKEALLKATGEGITGALSEVEVSFLPGEEARLLSVNGDTEQAARWSLRELAPAPGFTGALAIQTGDPANPLLLRFIRHESGRATHPAALNDTPAVSSPRNQPS